MPDATPTREVFLNFNTGMTLGFYFLAGLTTLIFLFGVGCRVYKVLQGRREHRFDRLGRRILDAIVIIAKNQTVRRGDKLAGLAHTLIFWGFTVLFIGTCIVAIDHDVLRFLDIKLLQGTFYLLFSLTLDLFGIVLIVGLILMMWRRHSLRPPQLDYTRADDHGGHYDRTPYVTDDRILLWLLLIISVTGFVIEGLRIAQTMPGFERWSPVGYVVASLLTVMFEYETLIDAHLWSWWVHGLLALFFVAYIPYSKMMHIFTDTVNLVFRDEHAGRKLPALPPGKPKPGKKKIVPQMGYERITDFTWKELLDTDACTKCGRCHVACPANAAGTTLSPRDLILDLRTHANAALSAPEWLPQRFEPQSKWPQPATPSPADHKDLDVAVAVIRPETLWSCTTCKACVEACPVGIEHITSIVQLRRRLVDLGELDDNLQGALMNLGDYGNSFGESPKKRGRWTKGLPFKVKNAAKEDVDVLWFVGDFASFDPRLQENSRLLALVLQEAGVDFGILYAAEKNAGNDVRRVGEEGLFEMLAEENIAALEKATFREIVTTDPHTLNTLRNEYPELGGKYVVRHYTELLAELLRDGKLPSSKLGHTVTYHDPCYLARYNGEVAAPRQVMESIGLDLAEMPRCGADTFCCGAGGGRIWMDTSNEQKRTSEQRIEEALALGRAKYFLTTCPKDFTMYSDAVKSLGKENEIQVKDLVQLVAESAGVESS